MNIYKYVGDNARRQSQTLLGGIWQQNKSQWAQIERQVISLNKNTYIVVVTE